MYYLTLFIVITTISITQIIMKILSKKIFSYNLESYFSLKALVFYLSLYELWILIILAFSTSFFWLITLKGLPLQIAYSGLAITFILVPIFSIIFLGEEFKPPIFFGCVLIFLGIVIIYVLGS